jgi:hypothetical protein
MATRARRRQAMVRGSSAVAILASLAVAGLVGRVMLRGRSLTPHVRVASAAVTDDNGDTAGPTKMASPSVSATTPTSAPAQQGAPLSAEPTHQQVAAPAVKPPISPLVPQGQSPLADSLFATRTDSGIVVWFDRTMVRTRNPQKFERLVRSTLPAIYGPAADSALRRIPEGGLAQQGDLINDLPTRGLRIPAAPGWTFSLFPITRVGHDGPLVTQYRVSVIRG